MALISIQEISLALGGPLLFDAISLQVERGERIALLGRNGAGKTTLMKVMTKQIGVDSGKNNEHVGGYSDWISVSQRELYTTAIDNSEGVAPEVKQEKRQLSYEEQRELKNLPAVIEKIEMQQNKLLDEMAKPEFFKQDSKEIEKAKQKLESIEDELLEVFSRWEELESLK